MMQHTNFVEGNQVIAQHPKLVFTKTQIEEQKKFMQELRKGNVKISFSGTFEEGISFLRETGKFVDTFNHT